MAKRGGFGGFPGGGNMQQMMMQAQRLQQQMQKVQEEAGEMQVEATAGGGAVKVVANGKKQILDIMISPDAVDPDDVEMLQDIIVAAVNEALNEADALMAREMNKVTGGMNLGGLV
ncbi:MAG: YbaB/EbfC family nucleoid-associated protein [Christensenellaceae bacterium]|nr:YbaB/EbfC family nucleoid-associated protein [Christensenellaceae bacterium]